MNYQKLLIEAASMDINDLVAHQKDLQSQAEFLKEIIDLRLKRGERTADMLKRESRKAEKSKAKSEKILKKDPARTVRNQTASEMNTTSDGDGSSLAEMFGKATQ